MTRSQRRVGWQDMLALGALLAVGALFMVPAWQQPDGFWYAPKASFSDLTVTHWPNMWFVAKTFARDGQIPLWRPLIMGGAPFVGNPLSALFYPPNWLFLVLPVTPTFHLLIGLHLFAAGAGLYALARWSYGCSAMAAWAGGLGYMLSPKVLAHLGAGHIGLSQAYAWVPVAIWLLRRTVSTLTPGPSPSEGEGRVLWVRGASRAAWCGTALAVMFFADPRVAFYATLLLGGYGAYRIGVAWATAGWRAGASLAMVLLLVPISFGLVAAVQIVPTAELMTTTTRSSLSLGEAGRDSLPWSYLAGYLIADRGGYHEWMTYLGLPVLGLAFFALVCAPLSRTAGILPAHPPRDRWFWAVVALVSLLFSLGLNAPLYPLLFRLLPGLGWLRVPPRALLLVVLSANLLAALGAESLFSTRWSERARQRIRLVSFAGFVLFGGIGMGFAWLVGKEAPAALTAFAGVGAALAALLMLNSFEPVPALVLQLGLIAVLGWDLWAVGHSVLEIRDHDQVFAEGDEVASYLAAQEGIFRTYSPSYSISQHVGAFHGLEQLDGVDPSQLAWVRSYMSLAGRYPVEGYGVTIPYFPDDTDIHTVWRNAVPDASLLGLLNGRFVVAEFPIDAPDLTFVAQIGGSYLYENERVLPRVFVMARAEPVSGWQEAQDRLREGFDPSSGALVEGGMALRGSAGYQAAEVRSVSPNHLVVEAQADEPALLVLSEVWYPGWTVRVDGERCLYYRVDGIVRGVYLDPGTHVVEWRYRPSRLLWGAAITVGGLGLLAACLSLCTKKYGSVVDSDG